MMNARRHAHSHGWLPSGADGSANAGGVAGSSSAHRTDVISPNAVRRRSRRSATAARSGSGADRPSMRPSPSSQRPVAASETRTSPAPALGRAACQAHHCSEGGQVARAVIERLAREWGRFLDALRGAPRGNDAGGGLHEAVEAVPSRPRSGLSPCAQGDAGTSTEPWVGCRVTSSANPTYGP